MFMSYMGMYGLFVLMGGWRAVNHLVTHEMVSFQWRIITFRKIARIYPMLDIMTPIKGSQPSSIRLELCDGEKYHGSCTALNA